jgi:hypothetical protein
MTPQHETMLAALDAAHFPYPVAFRPQVVWDLGAVLSIDAFDVPEARVLEVSDRLNDVLEPLGVEPHWLACAFDERESGRQRTELPPETVWYRPRRSRARTR